jgi:hypothetical protein
MAADTGKPSSNVGKWDDWYKSLSLQDMGSLRLYGDTVTYRMAAAFLTDVTEVEDWGCGAGGFKRFCRTRYVGVDGTKTPFADRVADLCTYTSRVEGIMMRHVIEHNYSWRAILDNAVSSFTKKLCLILFTPFSPETREIAHNRAHGIDAPDLSFCRADIEGSFTGLRWELFDNISTDTQYGIEHVYLVWRPERLRATGNELQGLIRRIVTRVGRRAVIGVPPGNARSIRPSWQITQNSSAASCVRHVHRGAAVARVSAAPRGSRVRPDRPANR